MEVLLRNIEFVIQLNKHLLDTSYVSSSLPSICYMPPNRVKSEMVFPIVLYLSYCFCSCKHLLFHKKIKDQYNICDLGT